MGKKSGSLFTYKSGDHFHMRASGFLLFDRLLLILAQTEAPTILTREQFKLLRSGYPEILS